ncbi:MAG: response regulator [Phycisphaerales bacterium JB037]
MNDRPAKATPRIARPVRIDPSLLSGPADASQPDSIDIRVLCVDDHEILVQGLRAQFAIDGRIGVVGYLPSAQDLLEEVTRLRPDVVILDIEMPGPDVFEAVDRMRRALPDQRFVFLSAHVRDGYLAAAYRAKAWGYFAKSDELEDIVEGIRQVATSRSGAFVMGPKVRQRCTHIAPTRPSTPPPPTPPAVPLQSLTPRELEVLRLIGTGRSRVEIARQLSRSPKTIDGHQDRLLKKLGLDSRAELMRFAIREGLAEA